ncbi:MAG: S41 family peptidase [Rhodothermales bacterium]|nr:S41 family peptidase [Rhodothermales bacterium]
MIKKHHAWAGLAGVLIVASFLAGAFWPRDDDFFAIRKSFEIFGGVYEELVANYVDRVDPERLMRTGIGAMLEELDPYTVFFDEADNADMDIITRGSYGGVGLNVGLRNGRITVIAPVEGASGYKQGVRAGDVISTVGGRSTRDLSLSDVQTLMRGEPGTTVDVSVEREGVPGGLDFVLTREQVKLHNVTYSGLIPGSRVGYVKLERFAQGAGREVRDAINGLRESGELDGVVLDLRDNPGGLLDEAVEITELFAPRGATIVSTSGRQPETKRVYAGRKAPLVQDTRLAIVTNGVSASASEIVAGAMQDLDRGVVVGTTTFGKGLVQIVRGLPYNTSLKLTTSRYYTPSGRSIQSIAYRFGHDPHELRRDSTEARYKTSGGRPVRAGYGVEPDVSVNDEPSALEQALRRRAAFFFFANHYAAAEPTVPEDFQPDDRLIRDFRDWLARQDFTYELPIEQKIAAIESTLTDEGLQEVRDELDQVRSAVGSIKEQEFDRNRDRIGELLRSEIVSRYHGERAQIRSSIATDAFIQEAVRVLTDPDRYNAILSPR